MSEGGAHYVFGYGSLARRHPGAPLVPAHLLDARRAWTVAMDKTVDLPGYKYYRDPAGGRPAVFVTFLDLVAAPGDAVNGLLLAVPAADLAALDARERNYERVEVSDRVPEAPDATVWAYRGAPAAHERFAAGLRSGRAVVARAYHEEVQAGFAALGRDARREYAASTDPLPCPVRDLVRVELGDAI